MYKEKCIKSLHKHQLLLLLSFQVDPIIFADTLRKKKSHFLIFKSPIIHPIQSTQLIWAFANQQWRNQTSLMFFGVFITFSSIFFSYSIFFFQNLQGHGGEGELEIKRKRLFLSWSCRKFLLVVKCPLSGQTFNCRLFHCLVLSRNSSY